MTEATTFSAAPASFRRFTDNLTGAAAEAVASLARLPGRLAAMRAEWRDDRDFDRIHGALSSLNARQLAMLGLRREDIDGFTELCVFQPERRPRLRLDDAGPALATPTPRRAIGGAANGAGADAATVGRRPDERTREAA